MKIERTEVVVVGGGVAGCATALALAQRCRQVVLVERFPERTERIGEVLPPGIREVLSWLELWEHFCRLRPLASAGVSLWWGSSECHEWDYLRGPYGNGWHVDRRSFESLLLDAAVAAGVKPCLGSPVARVIAQTNGSWLVHSAHRNGRTRTWQARFLVHAAGTSGVFRRLVGQRACFDRLIGLSQYFHRSLDLPALEPRLWLETTPAGWWYSAPLPDERLVAVFLTDADLAAGRSADCFRNNLHQAQHTADRLAEARPTSAVRAWSAQTSRVACFAGPSFLTVGDAAYRCDPARGHGVVKAMRSAWAAAEAIDAALGGRPAGLTAYQASLEAEFQRYLQGWPVQYEREMRWPSSSFWRRRHGPSETVAAGR